MNKEEPNETPVISELNNGIEFHEVEFNKNLTPVSLEEGETIHVYKTELQTPIQTQFLDINLHFENKLAMYAAAEFLDKYKRFIPEGHNYNIYFTEEDSAYLQFHRVRRAKETSEIDEQDFPDFLPENNI
jgi:hypothetical protein